MTYTTSIETLIQKRHSTRKYSDKKVSEDQKQELLSFSQQLATPKFRFAIVEYDQEKNEKLSTYGLIRNAKTFLIAIGLNSLADDYTTAVEFGYRFEQIILKATDMGLSTCWMGMSYQENSLKEKSGAKENESIIMATPIGFSEGLDLRERLGRMVIKADKRLDFDKLFFHENFNRSIQRFIQPEYRKVLDLVRLAPSAGNAQPWRVIQTDEGYDFYVRSKRFYDNMKNKRIDFAFNDLGIAKMHFEAGVESYGLDGYWTVKESGLIPKEIYAFSWVTNNSKES